MSGGFILAPPASSGGSLSDGDYGDVTVSGGGTVISIDAGAVTDAALIDRTALSVMGNETAVLGVVGDIVATGADEVLVVNPTGTALEWSTVATGGITDNAVTFSKIENILESSLIGRDSGGGGGDPQNITLNATLSMTGGGALQRAALTGDVTASAGSNATTIANDAVSNAKLRNSGACSVIGRSANSSGDPADISASVDGQYLIRNSNVVGFATIPTAMTLHTEMFNRASVYGTAASSPPTLVSTNPSIASATDPDDHVVGFSFPDGAVTWLHFSFVVPNDVSAGTNISPKLIFVTNGDTDGDVAIDIKGRLYVDAVPVASGDAFSDANVITIDAYTASNYAIVDMSSLSVAATAGVVISGVIQRDSTAGNAADTYADSITIIGIQFNGTRTYI